MPTIIKNVTLQFTEATPIKPETVIRLASKENKKYALLPDNRVSIRLNEITWARVYDELNQLMAASSIPF